jgi:hypothetical protein
VSAQDGNRRHEWLRCLSALAARFACENPQSRPGPPMARGRRSLANSRREAPPSCCTGRSEARLQGAVREIGEGTVSERLRSYLAGFTSQWTIPARWVACSASSRRNPRLVPDRGVAPLTLARGPATARRGDGPPPGRASTRGGMRGDAPLLYSARRDLGFSRKKGLPADCVPGYPNRGDAVGSPPAVIGGGRPAEGRAIARAASLPRSPATCLQLVLEGLLDDLATSPAFGWMALVERAAPASPRASRGS